jgi:hypothetical protein
LDFLTFLPDTMSGEIKSVDEPDCTAFFWTRDPEFVPPGKDGGVDACVSQEFAASRASEFKTLLTKFLEIAIGFEARAGVVRVLLSE